MIQLMKTDEDRQAWKTHTVKTVYGLSLELFCPSNYTATVVSRVPKVATLFLGVKMLMPGISFVVASRTTPVSNQATR